MSRRNRTERGTEDTPLFTQKGGKNGTERNSVPHVPPQNTGVPLVPLTERGTKQNVPTEQQNRTERSEGTRNGTTERSINWKELDRDQAIKELIVYAEQNEISELTTRQIQRLTGYGGTKSDSFKNEIKEMRS